MKLSKRQMKLLELGPEDARGNWQERVGPEDSVHEPEAAELARELKYLSLISSRQVALPDDRYFAGMRSKIEKRVVIRPVSFWKRLLAALWPENIRPVPGALAVGMLAVAVLTLVLYYPSMIKNSPVAYGPFVSIGESYDLNVASNEEGQFSPQELKEYRDILVMSTAILSSPSSLSRSRALSTGGK